MLFEKTSADVFIERIGEEIVDIFESLRYIFGVFSQWSFGYSVFKQLNEPLEGVLVHRIDYA